MTDRNELEGTAEFNRAHRTATQAMYRNYGVAWAKKAPEGASPLLPPPPPVSEQLAELAWALKRAYDEGYDDGCREGYERGYDNAWGDAP